MRATALLQGAVVVSALPQFCLGAASPTQAHGAEEPPTGLGITRLTTGEDLSQNSVSAIAQDRQGFVKFATRDGFLPEPIDQDELLDVLATELKRELIDAASTEMQPHAVLVFPPDDEAARRSQRARDLAQGFEMDEIVAPIEGSTQGRAR